MSDFSSDLERMYSPLLNLWQKEQDTNIIAIETANILASFSLHESFHEEELINEVLRTGLKSHYPAGSFSDFNCLLKENNFFRMELYFWDKLDTGIHSHPFYGAFQCLKGAVVVQDYSFKPTNVFTGAREIAFGELSLKGTKRMDAGDVYSISSGTDHIHKTLHLRPTVNLCIRSSSDPSVPNYNFLSPDFRIEKRNLSPEEEKILELFNYLSEKSAQAELLLEVLAQFDLNTLVFLFLSGPKLLNRLMSDKAALLFKDECKKKILEHEIFSKVFNSLDSNQVLMSKLNFAFK